MDKEWDDEWKEFLARAAFSKKPLFNIDNTKEWSSGFLDFLIQNDILVQAENLKMIVCDECGEQCTVEPGLIEDSRGVSHLLIICAQQGTTELEPGRVKQWKPDFPNFAMLLNKSLRLKKNPITKIEGEVYFLGYYPYEDMLLDCYLRISRTEPGENLSFPRNSLIFYLSEFSLPEIRNDEVIPVPLCETVVLCRNTIVPDFDFLNGILKRSLCIAPISAVEKEHYDKIPGMIIEKGKMETVITYNGEIFRFNERQSAIFFLLYEAFVKGTIFVSSKDLIDAMIQFNIYPKAISEVFRRHNNWKKLIIQEITKKGYYRLNIAEFK